MVLWSPDAQVGAPSAARQIWPRSVGGCGTRQRSVLFAALYL
jgi:hypothetical protein